jgi:hypothetical protein
MAAMEAPMDKLNPAVVAGFCLRQIREYLEKAAAIAGAADTCATAGNPKKAIEIPLDIEQLTYEAGALLNAASLLSRLDKS